MIVVFVSLVKAGVEVCVVEWVVKIWSGALINGPMSNNCLGKSSTWAMVALPGQTRLSLQGQRSGAWWHQLIP